jgi:hypothetical protein
VLGGRFLKAGREVATLVGTLSIRGEVHPVRIVRTQDERGDTVTIGMDEASPRLTWSPADGARKNGAVPAGDDRALIERIALDSPDEFVLAQLRGASYRLIAERVVPGGIKDLEDYTGPAWDVVRIGEPDLGTDKRPLSAARLYYINAESGFMDRVVSTENGETIVALFSNWIELEGERLPARTRWVVRDQTVMELSLTSVSHTSRQ